MHRRPFLNGMWAGAIAAIVLLAALPTAGRSQTALREGNESDFKDWQPTRGQVSTEERAAGVEQTPKERKAEDRALQQLYKELTDKAAGPSPSPPSAPR